MSSFKIFLSSNGGYFFLVKSSRLKKFITFNRFDTKSNVVAVVVAAASSSSATVEVKGKKICGYISLLPEQKNNYYDIYFILKQFNSLQRFLMMQVLIGIPFELRQYVSST